MKNKKIFVVCLIVIILIVLAVVGYHYIKSHTFPTQKDAKEQIFNRVKAIENETERVEFIDLLIQENMITEKEAKELY